MKIYKRTRRCTNPWTKIRCLECGKDVPIGEQYYCQRGSYAWCVDCLPIKYKDSVIMNKESPLKDSSLKSVEV